MACGTGVVGQELKDAGYTQVDGLDPSQGYLNGAMAKGIFRRVYKAFIDPDTPTSIPDCSYDAILCCAGFFQVIFILVWISSLSLREKLGINQLTTIFWRQDVCYRQIRAT